ncbi:MAG: DNA translocase FtsK [Bacillales bacterium]|nr:DNA translocase FtsK [Bacillales bacterium]
MTKSKRKQLLVVKMRTPDIVPFKIPKITDNDSKEDDFSHFASPIYGKDVKDEVILTRKSDTKVEAYDAFRVEPLKSKNEEDPYPEFRKVYTIKKKEPIKDLTEEKEEKVKEEPPKEEEKSASLFIYKEEETKAVDDTMLNDLFGISKEETKEEKIAPSIVKDTKSSFKLPPLSLLKDPLFETSDDKEWIDQNIKILNKTLADFKIDGEVHDFTQGPAITRYSIILGSGVSGSKIENIQNDIQRALSARSVRIENPIPGKTYVGIEVPNRKRRVVSLKELISTDEFTKNSDPLFVPVGLDVEGKPKYISISSLPHALVAGSSGSGKSVFISSLIASILYKNTPDQVKFFFVDPKKVDLQQFNGIPHLIAPIVDETKDAIASLRWLIDEMERRLTILQATKTINITDYEKRGKESPYYKNMPRIIIIIEEAGDFLMTGGSEAEDLIIRLAQKSRAVGIHIILAMQKPVAKQLSSSIKANTSGRFAFRVPQQTDSQVILDTGGAEKLLGNGDMMFYFSGNIGRYQGAFITPEEINSICDYVAGEAAPEYEFIPEELDKKSYKNEQEQIDPLFEEVARYVTREQKCSINSISQEFSIGFNRAYGIAESMERYGIVSPNLGTKPREVYFTEDEIDEVMRKITG